MRRFMLVVKVFIPIWVAIGVTMGDNRLLFIGTEVLSLLPFGAVMIHVMTKEG